MYLEHFELSSPPFQFTASPTALFMSHTHREALAALEWGILHEPSGLTLLAGESGVGKTTVVCATLARQHRQVRAAYLGSPRLSFEELLGSILSQLGVRGGRSGKAAMINAFANFSAALPADERIAILIDEAQGLSDGALEDFRLLSNLEHGGRKAAQIILAGQFELARRLSTPEMRHLNERIGARAVLVPLTALETRQYIEHRLRLCGAGTEKIFERRALDQVVRHSGGVPRRINALSHNAMLLAYSSGAKRVSAAMVGSAATDYDGLGDLAARSRARSGFNFGGRSMLRPVLGMGLLSVLGFVTGRAVLDHHPICHVRSLIAHTATVEANTGGAAPAAAAIDPEIVIGTPSADAATARPARDTSLPTTEPAPLPIREASSSIPTETMIVKTDAAVPATVAPRPHRRSVTVNPGDTLSRIALRYFGSTGAIDTLLRLNPQIVDASRLYPGETIYLSTASHTDEDVE
jgi:general secretion pathway protein A